MVSSSRLAKDKKERIGSFLLLLEEKRDLLYCASAIEQCR